MGLVLVNKPRGIGSQDFLGRLKRELGLPGKAREGIGHTGTLDPFAEGLLCVGTGEGTKLLSPLGGLPKCYAASMLMGITSDTLDDTGTITAAPEPFDCKRLAKKLKPKIEEYLQSKIGAFEQMPPAFSAIHIDGKRAYEWAREGQAKELKSRPAILLEAKHLALNPVTWEGREVLQWDFEVFVSSGTYIRCFARDWGEELSGTAGLLSKLVRTQIGPFLMPESRPGATLEEETQWLQTPDLKSLFHTHTLSPAEAEALRRFGRWEPRPQALPALLVDSSTGEIVAWAQAGDGKLGRVFLSDPLARV